LSITRLRPGIHIYLAPAVWLGSSWGNRVAASTIKPVIFELGNAGCPGGLSAPDFDEVQHMFRSLRSTLILPWLFVAVVCCALTFQLRGLFELGVGGEIEKVKDSVEDSAGQIRQELSLYLNGFSEAPANFDDSDRQRELLLLLDLVLGRFYGIEGGFWSPRGQFIAYSFPTHDTMKRDVPEGRNGPYCRLE
jgi:hypothetical protein